MEKNKKNEELQSRREFFKQAAKGALPVLGAILLANTPSILKAESTPMGCSEYSCTNTCATGCTGRCYHACTGCDSTCTGTCYRTCSGSCSGHCNTSCYGHSR